MQQLNLIQFLNPKKSNIKQIFKSFFTSQLIHINDAQRMINIHLTKQMIQQQSLIYLYERCGNIIYIFYFRMKIDFNKIIIKFQSGYIFLYKIQIILLEYFRISMILVLNSGYLNQTIKLIFSIILFFTLYNSEQNEYTTIIKKAKLELEKQQIHIYMKNLKFLLSINYFLIFNQFVLISPSRIQKN
ncbi:hypothetical protein pb186bvf_015698 [Paramecium bursaria]